MAAGLLGLPRISDIVIGTLCKYTVPSWHGQDLSESNYADVTTRSSLSSTNSQLLTNDGNIRWKHIQAQVRLFQVLSVLGDVITDWDSVVDALDQIHRHYAARKVLVSDEVSMTEIEKIFAAINR